MYCFNCAKMDTRFRTQHSINNASENFVNFSGPNRRLEGELRASAWHGLTLRSCFWIKLMFVTWSNKSSFSHWRLFQCSFREGHGKKLAIEMHHLNIQGKNNNSQRLCVFQEVSHHCASRSSFGWLFIVSPYCSTGAILRKPAIFWVYSTSSHRRVSRPT